MKILVLGATGKTGSILVEELLKEKYEVSVLVRNKNKIDINNTLLKVYEGNVLNHDQLAESMRGVEMVISCLGGDDNKKSDLLTQMSKSITEVMNEFNVKRLVVMSSAGIHGEFNDIISKIIVKLFFGNAIKDHKGAAEHIMSTDINYTLLRPLSLTDGDLTKEYQVAVDGIPKGSRNISRKDVVHFIMKVIQTDLYEFKSVCISN